MEKERDFYFGKLRNIELICQEKEGEEDDTLSRIVSILYATDVSLLCFSVGTLGRCFRLSSRLDVSTVLLNEGAFVSVPHQQLVAGWLFRRSGYRLEPVSAPLQGGSQIKAHVLR